MIHIEIENRDAFFLASVINRTSEYMTEIVALLETLPDEYRAGPLEARGRELGNIISTVFVEAFKTGDAGIGEEGEE